MTSRLITEAAEHLSTADLPKKITEAIRLGFHSTSEEEWQHQGHHCGGHIPPRSRTHQGTDCVARVVMLLTELCPKKTMLSIDGIGAFDHIKRKSMLEALHNNSALAPFFPLSGRSTARTPRTYGTTTKGCPTRSRRARGRATGRPHAGVVCFASARSSRSRGRFIARRGDAFAFLEDIYILCDPPAFLRSSSRSSNARFAGIQVASWASRALWALDGGPSNSLRNCVLVCGARACTCDKQSAQDAQ